MTLDAAAQRRVARCLQGSGMFVNPDDVLDVQHDGLLVLLAGGHGMWVAPSAARAIRAALAPEPVDAVHVPGREDAHDDLHCRALGRHQPKAWLSDWPEGPTYCKACGVLLVRTPATERVIVARMVNAATEGRHEPALAAQLAPVLDHGLAWMRYGR